MNCAIVIVAALLSAANAGNVVPSYPLTYAPAAPIVHYERTIPFNVPPFASTTSYSARSLYGVPAYAASPVAHSPGPVAQVSTLLRQYNIEHSPSALGAHHPVANGLTAALPAAHAAHLPLTHAAPLAHPLPVANAAPLPVAHSNLPIAVRAHHPLTYAATSHTYSTGVHTAPLYSH